MSDPARKVVWPAETHHLDGARALDFVRQRYRLPAGSTPPLTDVIGHLLEAEQVGLGRGEGGQGQHPDVLLDQGPDVVDLEPAAADGSSNRYM